MATKVYKSNYQIIVDKELKPYNKYSASMFCSFGFDGETCWIKEIADTKEYIYNDNVDQMADSAGTLVGDLAAVEAYLVQIIGDPTDTDSPLI